MVRIDGENHYCITEPVTIALIGAWQSKDRAIELETQLSHWKSRVGLLELNIEQLELVVAEKDTVIAVTDEVVELTEAEVKRLRRRAVSNWFKSVGGQVLVGVTGFGVGVGVGVALGR